MHLVSEEIVDLDTKETLVQYKASAGGRIKGDKGELSIMPNFVITSSCLKVIQHLHGVDSRLNRLVAFFDNSESFEMLAPDNMRLSSRGVVKNIGETGKNLPSFIRQMSAEQKNNFMSKLKRIMGARISDVSASVKGKPGWTLINVKEHYDTGDVDFSNKECIVFGKGDKQRKVYFDAKTKIHLQQYIETRKDNNPALFVSLLYPYNRLKVSGVEIALRKIGEHLEIGNVHPHKFRRTLATKAIDKGMPIEQVQHLLGHAKIDTTLEYAMVDDENVKISHKKYLG